ncbi:hypothetical protein ACFL4N_01660 [Thermodesulfobacteriota bacterium]
MARITLLTGLCFFLFILPLQAKPVVECEVKKVVQHKLLVTFAWKAKITSDKGWDACDLSISFLDGKGREVYEIRERLNLKVGDNTFEGNEICDSAIWQRMRKYITTLDCVF